MKRSVPVSSVVLLTMLVAAAPAMAHVVDMVNVSSTGQPGNGDSGAPVISSNGRYVLFGSAATNLDTHNEGGAFVRDRQTGQTTRVSVSSTGALADAGCNAGGGGGGGISGDGRVVLLWSDATNLVADDPAGTDWFLHDCLTGETTLVPRPADQGYGIDFGWTDGALTPDGRYVARADYVWGDGGLFPDYAVVSIYDRQLDVLMEVFHSAAIWEPIENLRITPDARFVLCDMRIMPGGGDYRQPHVYDRQTSVLERVDLSSSGQEGDSANYGGDITPDGRWVAFASTSTNLVPGDTNWRCDVFVRDRQTGQTERVSVSSSGGQGDDQSWQASISDDGRYVAFETAATNLVAGDTNGARDILVHDRQTAETIRASVDASGNQANGSSYYPLLCGSGQFVGSMSKATNLIPGGTSGQQAFVAANVLLETAPTRPTVDVTPDAPTTDDDLTCTITQASIDPNGDPITYRYRWYKDDVHQADYDDLTTVPSSATTKGETWKCVVTPNDGTEDGPSGEDSVTVLNSPPTQPTVEVTPVAPEPGDDLACVVTTESTDADGDSVTYEYRWYKDDVPQAAYDDLTTVPASATAKGQTWKCVVTPNDGTDDGTSGEDSAQVGNTAPTQPTVDVTPDVPKSDQDLTCTVTGPSTDADGDTVTYLYRWFKDDVPQAAYNDLTTVPASATARGETWKCVVTPNDGTEDGPTAEDSVTVANSPPTQPTVEVTPNPPLVSDDLTCAITTASTDVDGDPVTYTYRWYKDGVRQAAYDDLTTVPASATAKGETWKCVVTPNDGTEDGPRGKDWVTVGNSPPTQPTVEVTPTVPEPGDDLTCVVTTESTDADGDSVTYKYRWYKDDVHQAAYDDLTTVPASATAKGQTWKCVVTPNDGAADGPSGEDSAQVGNTAPTQPTVGVTPDVPRSDQDLTCTVTGPSTDVDGDTVTYLYRWSKGDVPQAGYNDLTTVPALATARGETWKCVVTPNDGTESGPSAEDSVTVANSPPTLPTVDVTPHAPLVSDDLTCAITTASTDVDGDPVTYTYRWYKDGVRQAAYDDLTTVPASATAQGETWKCVATPSDGTEDGPRGKAWVTVGNTPPTQPTVDVTPDVPSPYDDLICAVTTDSTDADGDAVTYKRRWYKDEVQQSAYDDLTTVPASVTEEGQTWKCVVTPNDGASDGPSAQDEVTIVAASVTWAGTPGYESDGADPDIGYPQGGDTPTTFTFKVKYTDPSGKLPLVRKCIIQMRADDGTWVQCRSLIMALESGDIATGAIYSATAELPNQTLKYRFDFRDSAGTPLDGPPTVYGDGPLIIGRPKLLWPKQFGFEGDGVNPNSGQLGTAFQFRVSYADSAGDAPTTYELLLRRNGVIFRHKALSSAPTGDLRLGQIFRTSVIIDKPGVYEYRFHFVDASGNALGPPNNWAAGPTITAGAAGAAVTSLATMPTAGGAQITFVLSAPAQVGARVLNLAGRPVRRLCEAKSCGAGTYTLLWNARADTGLRVPTGAYLVEVTSRAEDGSEARALAQIRIGQ